MEFTDNMAHTGSDYNGVGLNQRGSIPMGKLRISGWVQGLLGSKLGDLGGVA